MTGARSLDIPKIFKEMIVTPFFLAVAKSVGLKWLHELDLEGENNVISNQFGIS